MKKLMLIIAIIALGSICQAQSLNTKIVNTLQQLANNQALLTDVMAGMSGDIDVMNKTINANAHFDVRKFNDLDKTISQLLQRVDLLEKKVCRLEQKNIQDSLKYLRIVQPVDWKSDTIWIDSEMDLFNGTVPVIMKRQTR